MSIIKKYTFLSADWDSEAGISKVRINTDIGAFEGMAKLHPDDYPSMFIGCEIAEIRAVIKFYKAQKRKCVAQLDAISSIYRNWVMITGIGEEPKAYRLLIENQSRLAREIRWLETDIKFFEQKIKTISLSIPPKRK